MRFIVKIEVEAESKKIARNDIETIGFAVVDVERIDIASSAKQKRALHLWFSMIADELNNAGIIVQDIIKVERTWTLLSFKELVYKHILLKKYGKKSTKKMTSEEMQTIFDDINLWLANMGIHVPFPAEERLKVEERHKN